MSVSNRDGLHVVLALAPQKVVDRTKCPEKDHENDQRNGRPAI